jgi:NAD dependent epimerase/dehydratase
MPALEGSRILVTGAGGFIGSHAAEALVVAGAEVRAFVRYNSRNDYGWLESIPEEARRSIEVFRGDLINPDAVANSVKGMDTVVHLGALIPIPYSYVHPREFIAANITGTFNVLEAARQHDLGRVVHVSSSEVYGTPETTPIAETHPLRAQSPYAATKIGADQLSLSYFHSFDLPVVIARPFNTFGPRQSARAVIPTIIAQALVGGTVRLGNLSATRDLVYVSDTVDALRRCCSAEGAVGTVINIGSGSEISVGALAGLIFEIMGTDVALVSDAERVRPESSEVERLLADAGRAAEILDWTPEVGLREGLEKTIAWITESLDAYKPSIYNV